jgi:uncharacterized delta-60 repeat protein
MNKLQDNKSIPLAVALSALLSATPLAAAPTLAPDPVFGSAGVSALATTSYESFVASVPTADGKTLAIGNLGTNLGSDLLLARFLADGRLDESFGIEGQSALDLGARDDAARAGLALADGRLLVVGQSGSRPLVAAFTADGNLDQSFGNLGRVRLALSNAALGSFVALVRLADGSLLAGGDALVGGEQRPLLARLGADGRLDTGFDHDGVLVMDDMLGQASAIAPAADGGAFIAVHARGGLRVVRISAAGTLDAGFGVGGIAEVPSADHSPVVALVQDGAQLVLAERALGRLTQLAVDGRSQRQSFLLADGELAALARAPDGVWVAGLERVVAGRIVAQAAVLTVGADAAPVLGASLAIAADGERLVAVRAVDASQAGRVRFAGYQFSGGQTDAWLASLALQAGPVAVAAVANRPVAAAPLPKFCSKRKLNKKKMRICGRV